MANCSKEFRDFNSEIRLTDARRLSLQESRDALRIRMATNFSGLGEHQPQFQGQGSYVMDTITNPIDTDYDLDDGVYFIGNLNQNQRPTPAEFHAAVMDAVRDQTNEVTDKNTCVRVRYAAGYHIDLPIYYASYHHPELAHKSLGWFLSNPLEFIVWFENATGSGFQLDFLLDAAKQPEYLRWVEDVRKYDVQLRRVVRYFKAWADYQGKDKMPAGVCLTILATENYHSHINDDQAFHSTATSMLNSLNYKFECIRPTTPEGEDLFEDYSQEQKKYFMTRLQELVLDGNKAMKAEYTSESCGHWRKHFGPRFKCITPKEKPMVAAGLADLARPAGKPYSQTWTGR